ncbi:hypothetical protein [Mesorhizobium sp.]|uniref:hypothetical protein n=1 Tax=Mesorhizobium sp. TaxID=1871066 RepID=UPI0025C19A76|nr:hypothetical protein [Mesorhizobium sp.]
MALAAPQAGSSGNPCRSAGMSRSRFEPADDVEPVPSLVAESVTAGAENVDAFIPFDLPPARTALFVEGKLERRLREAEQALVRLDLAGDMVPTLDDAATALIQPV